MFLPCQSRVMIVYTAAVVCVRLSHCQWAFSFIHQLMFQLDSEQQQQQQQQLTFHELISPDELIHSPSRLVFFFLFFLFFKLRDLKRVRKNWFSPEWLEIRRGDVTAPGAPCCFHYAQLSFLEVLFTAPALLPPAAPGFTGSLRIRFWCSV